MCAYCRQNVDYKELLKRYMVHVQYIAESNFFDSDTGYLNQEDLVVLSYLMREVV